MVKKLPNKPSKLLKLALTDLEKIEKDRRYKVEMVTWHRPNGVCAVCLAGSVMAKSLNVGIKRHVDPETVFEESDDNDTEEACKLQGKLRALNCLRIGSLQEAFDYLGIEVPARLKDIKIVYDDKTEDASYEQVMGDMQILDRMSDFNRKEWKLHMQDLIGILEAEGL